MITARKQHGVVLFIALIVLVAMSLAGVALWRSIGTGVLIAGNIAMQRGAVTSSDGGIETARTWLVNPANAAILNSTQPAGYISNWDERFNTTTFDWDTLSTAVTTDSAGFATRYVIHRLCKVPNVGPNDPTQQCLKMIVDGGSSSRGGGGYGTTPLGGVSYIYYRITSRAIGPRNTVSYTQSIMY